MTERHANRICDFVTIEFYLYEAENGQTTVHIMGWMGCRARTAFHEQSNER